MDRFFTWGLPALPFPVFVTIGWNQRKLAVPLAQLEVIDADDQTREAVDDWLYWIGMGYQF